MIEPLSESILREHRGKSSVGFSTAAALFNPKGELLLLKRSANARDEQGRWDFCAGGLEVGLTLEQNVHKEIEEELGLTTTKKPHFIHLVEAFRTDASGENTHWLCARYILLLESSECDQIKINEPDKFDAIGWFSQKEVPVGLHSMLIPEIMQEVFTAYTKISSDAK